MSELNKNAAQRSALKRSLSASPPPLRASASIDSVVSQRRNPHLTPRYSLPDLPSLPPPPHAPLAYHYSQSDQHATLSDVTYAYPPAYTFLRPRHDRWVLSLVSLFVLSFIAVAVVSSCSNSYFLAVEAKIAEMKEQEEREREEREHEKSGRDEERRRLEDTAREEDG